MNKNPEETSQKSVDLFVGFFWSFFNRSQPERDAGGRRGFYSWALGISPPWSWKRGRLRGPSHGTFNPWPLGKGTCFSGQERATGALGTMR